MNENPMFSVIVPTFNRSKLLRRAIQSVFQQTYDNWELIIIDNYSEDNSLEVISSFDQSKIKLLQIKNNGVIGTSRNLGIKNAKGNYLAFLDSDDWWKKNKLQTSLSFFINQEVDIIYHNCIRKKDTISKSTNCRSLNKNAYEDLLLNGNTLVTSSVIVSRKVVKNLKFSEDQDHVGWEDYDLWIKIAYHNFKFKLISDDLGYYNIGIDNFDNPERILLNIDRISKHILSPYKELKKIDYIWWPDYTKGLAFLALKKYKKSINSFRKVIFKKSPLLTKIKSIYLIIIKIYLSNISKPNYDKI